jgi:hypothetical protein
MSKLTFKSILERPEGVGTWTYVAVPLDLHEALGSRGQIRVKCTIGGHIFRASAMPKGDGTHYIVVNKSVRDAIGVTRGDVVEMTIERDTAERKVDMPADLAAALEQHPTAAAAFAKLSYSHQKEYVDWIDSAKKEETRQRRVEGTVERVIEGRGQGSVKAKV